MADLLTLIAEPGQTGEVEIALPVEYAARGARRSDIEALGRLYHDAYEPGVACDTLDEAVADIRASFDGGYGELWPAATRVVHRGDELAAAIMTVRRAPWGDTPDCPFIIELLTARAHRRRGLARSLVARCLATARGAGEPAVALRVDQENTAARTLYESLGFKVWRSGS